MRLIVVSVHMCLKETVYHTMFTLSMMLDTSTQATDLIVVVVTVVILTATILPGDPGLWSCVIYYAVGISATYKWKD